MCQFHWTWRIESFEPLNLDGWGWGPLGLCAAFQSLQTPRPRCSIGRSRRISQLRNLRTDESTIQLTHQEHRHDMRGGACAFRSTVSSELYLSLSQSAVQDTHRLLALGSDTIRDSTAACPGLVVKLPSAMPPPCMPSCQRLKATAIAILPRHAILDYPIRRDPTAVFRLRAQALSRTLPVPALNPTRTTATTSMNPPSIPDSYPLPPTKHIHHSLACWRRRNSRCRAPRTKST
ncbi:hypothetical protein QBC46DRAFT_420897 [Diplogelasinospora grovesii]|uniref:Uncharacterized protein n=1 Tax=Diplogelasinospora grovesii TaxID=303347 RepID=A0AAN6S879_9PEZI|nr:hypothetical protein QBC46DRAFT_420897 [Diplogelasinospora grovesii]